MSQITHCERQSTEPLLFLQLLQSTLLLGLIGSFCFSSQLFAVDLVTEETVQTQIKLSSEHTLKNGIPVIIRQEPNSEILNLHVSFNQGMKDLPQEKKVLHSWLWPVMTMAAKDYPKQKFYQIVEKYALNLGCSGGIELSSCALGTVNEYWEEGLDILTAAIKAPLLTEEDIKLVQERLVSSYKNRPADPGSFVNDVTNEIFYPVGHPYRLTHLSALDQLAKLGRKDLLDYHKTIVNSSAMTIVVVTSMDAAKVVKDLNAAFGDIKKQQFKPTKLPQLKFDAKKATNFEGREIPTAYIRVKFVSVPADDEDAIATRLLFEILSKELWEEIRTKRSLSYSVYSYFMPYEMGIGVLSASTSNPKETIIGLADVIKTLQNKTYSSTDIEEYKRVFATQYFLTQETHGSLASALAATHHYHGSVEHLYKMPRELADVDAADIKRLAGEQLKNMNVGVIYDEKKFEQQWLKDFIDKTKLKQAG